MMKNAKMFFRVVALCMVLVFTLSFTTACKPSGGGMVNDLKFDEYGEIIFDGTELTVWSVIGEPDNAYLDVVNKQFNDYYSSNGLSAKIVSLSVGDFYTQLANTINTDPESAPDVVIYHSERLTDLANSKIILPMDEYFAAIPNNDFSTDNYYRSLMQECMYDGKVYGVPLDVHGGMWYVRTDILEKNGLEMPTSLSEFVEVCNQLITLYEEGRLWHRAMDKTNPANCNWTQAKDLGEHFYPVVMSDEGGIENGWIPQTAVLQNGGKLVGENGRPAWNTDALVEVMTMFRNWQSGEGDFNGTPYAGKFVEGNDDAQTVWSKLSSGAAVFSCEGPWFAEQRLEEYNAVLGSLTDSQGKTYSPLGLLNMSKLYALDENSADASKIYGVGHAFSISRTVTSMTKAVGAALYAQYMTEHSMDYLQGGHLPAYKAIYESEEFKSQPFYQQYLQAFGSPENYVTLGNTAYYTEVYEQLKGVYIDIFTASKLNKTPQEIVTDRFNTALALIEADEEL